MNSKCSFCLSEEEEDGRTYVTSDDKSACICSNCASLITQHMLNNQDDAEENQEDKRTLVTSIKAFMDSSEMGKAKVKVRFLTGQNGSAETQFNNILGMLKIEETSLLGGYYKEDPRYNKKNAKLALDHILLGALNGADGKLIGLIDEQITNFLSQPDLGCFWKYALLAIKLEALSGDMDEPVAFGFPSPWAAGSALVDNDWRFSVETFQTLSAFYENSPPANPNEYRDVLNSLFFCGLAAATDPENFDEDGIKSWVWGIGDNRVFDDAWVSFGIIDLDYGSGEFMSSARRFAEEVLYVSFEVPTGTDPNADAYLDGYDWDQVVDEVVQAIG